MKHVNHELIENHYIESMKTDRIDNGVKKAYYIKNPYINNEGEKYGIFQFLGKFDFYKYELMQWNTGLDIWMHIEEFEYPAAAEQELWKLNQIL